jgi:transposase InsO family protein
VWQTLGVSERRVCRTLGQHRTAQRKVPCGQPDEERLTEDIIELTRQFGRYGYLPMRKGFLYLVAIMDWHTRKVLARRISNTLEADFCVEALNEAIHKFGPPEIMNTDQGSQFTSFAWTDRLKRLGTRISMDGKGRCLDNIFIERLWRSLKYECVYLNAWETGSQAKAGVGHWIVRPLSRTGGVRGLTLQPPAVPRRPWRPTARRGLLQPHRNRSAGAGRSLNHPEICPKIGG